MIRLILIALLIASTTAATHAQLPGLSAGVGGTFTASGSFKDSHDAGYHVQASYGGGILPILKIETRLAYHRVPRSFLVSNTGNPVEGADLSIWSFGTEGRLGLPLTGLYASAGPGVARVTESSLSSGISPTDVGSILLGTQTKAYVTAAVGMRFSAGPLLKGYLEARYLRIFTDGTTVGLIPITIGIAF